MAIDKNLISSLFVHADTALIHGQRLGELCGHGPVLEQDIALTNISLDYIGRARLYYDLISKLEGNKNGVANGSSDWVMTQISHIRKCRMLLLICGCM